MLAPAVRADHFSFVLGECENFFEFLMAIEAKIVVHRHGNLLWGAPGDFERILVSFGSAVCDFSTELKSGE
jgi:hypothetical protein